MGISRDKERRFVVRKYVMARSAKEAIDKEPTVQVSEVFEDEKPKDDGNRTSAIGFAMPTVSDASDE